MLLIHPPVAKPCEPPPGIATLAGALKAGGVSVRVLDASAEALLFLMDGVGAADDTWTRRALRHRQAHRQALVQWPIYAHRDRYRRAVLDLNRLLEAASGPSGVRVGLADYHDGNRTPVRSRDLLAAAHDYKTSVFYPYFQARVGPLVAEEAPAWVGISLNYLSQALPAFALIGFLRHGFPRTRIIVGGGLVTSWVSRPDWQNPFDGLIDRVVAGPGEDLLLELCGKISGEEGGLPDFEGLLRSGYLAPGPVLPYAASRGCYWRKCAFCPERAEGRSFQPRAPQQVIADLDLLCERHRPALIHLVDNALSPALLGALADHPPAAPWYGFARISPRLADPEFCRALKCSGCVMIKLGLESGDANVLTRMGKGIDPTLAAAVLGALNRAGIATYVYLLFGTPWEDEAAAERTLAFTAAHAGAIDFLNLAVFNLPAHSPEAAALKTHSFYEGDLNLYSDFVHPAGWSRGRVRRFLGKGFRRHPAMAPILRRQPPLFTSNHAPLVAMARQR